MRRSRVKVELKGEAWRLDSGAESGKNIKTRCFRLQCATSVALRSIRIVGAAHRLHHATNEVLSWVTDGERLAWRVSVWELKRESALEEEEASDWAWIWFCARQLDVHPKCGVCWYFKSCRC